MKDIVLIADDIKTNRDTLKKILGDTYDIIEAQSREQTIEAIRNNCKSIAVILFDIAMPGLSGLELLEIMHSEGWINSIPVLVISSRTDGEYLRKCFEAGVTDYIPKPFDTLIIRQRVKTVIGLFKNNKGLEDIIDEQTKELKIKNKRLNETNEKIIEFLGNVVEARNLESGIHVGHVKKFTRIIAEDVKNNYPEYDLTDEKIDTIVSASALHDIGKIMIPDSILLKPSKLTEYEYELMKTHTTKGSELLEGVRDIWGNDYADVCREIVLYHHERIDGKGYPKGLKGDEIPISAQIVSLADVYDALVAGRVYKKSISAEKAHDMIISGECGAFSEKMKECLERNKEEMRNMIEQEA